MRVEKLVIKAVVSLSKRIPLPPSPSMPAKLPAHEKNSFYLNKIDIYRLPELKSTLR